MAFWLLSENLSAPSKILTFHSVMDRLIRHNKSVFRLESLETLPRTRMYQAWHNYCSSLTDRL